MRTPTRIILAAGIGIVPALAFDADSLDIHGFISQGFLYTTDNNWVANTADGTFQYNEAAINVSADLTDTLRAGMQLFAYDLGPVGNNKVVIDWAFLDYRYRQEFGLRAGRAKIKSGLYNEFQDVDAVRPTILLPQSVYYQMSYREASVAANGIQAYGNIDLSSAGDIDYQAMVGTLSMDADSSLGQSFKNEGMDIVSSLDSEMAYNIGLVYNTPVEGLRVGGTFLHIENIEAAGKANVNIPFAAPGIGPLNINVIDVNFALPNYDIYVGSIEYTWENLTLAAEYRYIDRDIVVSQTANVSGVGVIDIAPENAYTDTEDGYYIQASYLFKDIWTASVYYSVYNNDTDDRNSDNPGRRFNDIALAMRCDINEFWNAKAEIHFLDGYGIDGVSSSKDDGTLEEDWVMLALKTTLTF